MSKIVEFLIVLSLTFSIVFTVMAIFFFVLINKFRKNLALKQKEALTNFILGQEEERQRLARDLHDEMGPQLAGIIFTVDRIKTEDAAVQELIVETKAELKKAIQEVRHISHALMSQSLIKYGLIEAIQELMDRQPKSAIPIEFSYNSTGLEYNDDIKSHLFKITQEMVYNSNKHSKASLITIEVNIDEDKRSLEYVYKDNGVGNPNFNPLEAGIGLKNIKTRVEMMNGEIELNLKSGFNCLIKINY